MKGSVRTCPLWLFLFFLGQTAVATMAAIRAERAHFSSCPILYKMGLMEKNREQDGPPVKAGMFKFKVFLNDWLPLPLPSGEGSNI
jgi:hypothetical protein